MAFNNIKADLDQQQLKHLESMDRAKNSIVDLTRQKYTYSIVIGVFFFLLLVVTGLAIYGFLMISQLQVINES